MDDLRVGQNGASDMFAGEPPSVGDGRDRRLASGIIGLAPMFTPVPTHVTVRRADVGSPVRVLLVDDHAVVREGLMMVLGQEAGLAIVGEATDGVTALEMAERLRPDVVLMDVGLPGMDGIETTRRLTAVLERVKVVGLSMHDEGATAELMRAAGAVDYLSKGCEPDRLIAAIYRAAGNRTDGPRVRTGDGQGAGQGDA